MQAVYGFACVTGVDFLRSGKMEFDKTKGYCNGVNINGTGCEFTFHLLKHTHDEITAKSCKDCSCPPAQMHRKQYAIKRREMRGNSTAAN